MQTDRWEHKEAAANGEVVHVQCRCLEYAARASCIRLTRYAREYID